jgi:DNA-binding GntR family transcriptional regulator
MLGFCETTRERASRYRSLALTTAYPTRDVAAEHAAIVNAALARDISRACQLLVQHYTRTADYLRLALKMSEDMCAEPDPELEAHGLAGTARSGALPGG